MSLAGCLVLTGCNKQQTEKTDTAGTYTGMEDRRDNHRLEGTRRRSYIRSGK